MKKLIFLFPAFCYYQATAQPPTTRDMEFAERAAADGMMEVKLGELAQTHASLPEVKTHAQSMIDEHGAANAELKDLASRKNINLATGTDKNKETCYDKLAKLNGKEFDKAYSKQMVKKHKKAICLFKKESKKGDDTELKSWAAQKTPTLEHHLAMWKETCKASHH